MNKIAGKKHDRQQHADRCHRFVATACMVAALVGFVQPDVAAGSGPEERENLLTDGGFESGELRNAIHWRSASSIDVTRDDAFAGEWSLGLRGEAAAATTISIPVEPDQQYRMTFMAKVDGPGVIATDAPGALERLRATQGLASWRLNFHHNESPDTRLNRGFPQFFTKIVHDEWTAYREDFYPPTGANQVQIVFVNGAEGNELTIDAIELVAVDEGPMNLNPDISFGALNFTGYSYARQARIVPKDDESEDSYLDTTEGWVIGDPIPVEQRTYQFSFRGRAPAQGERVGTRLRYTDADMEEVGELSVRSLNIYDAEWTERSYAFVPPPEAAFIRIIAGGGHHDWFRIDEVEGTPPSDHSGEEQP